MSARVWLRRLAVASASTALALFAAELGTRLWLFGGNALSIEKLRSVRPIGDAGILHPARNAELGYQLAPGLDVCFKLARFRTNSRGLRDRELTLPKPPGTLRVAVLGDSFTMASGVEIEDAYHSRLELLADAARPDVRHDFVNFGVGGYGLRHYLALLEHEVAYCQADLVLIGFCAANDHLVTAPPGPRRFSARAPRSRLARSFLLELLRQAWWSWNRERGAAGDAAGGWDDAQRAYIEEQFAAIAAWRDRTGIPVVVALLAVEPLDPTPLAEVCARLGLSFVDTTAGFAAGGKASYRVSAIDHHANARGHALQAEAILAHLLSGGLLER